jgi:hypothetical protein
MIGQNSNNKASGQVAKECDAGLPISGRITNNGEYEILKVNADGTMVTTAIQIATGTYLQFASTITNATGVLATGTIIARTQLGAFDSGLYRINPSYMWDGAAGGGISFILYNSLGALYTYINGRLDGQAFAPTLVNIAPNGGIAAYWHNTATQNFGGNIFTSYNRNQTLDVFLDTDTYYFVMVSDGNVTINNANSVFGCIEITKLS